MRVRGAGMNPSDVMNVLGRLPRDVRFHARPAATSPASSRSGPRSGSGADVWGTGAELGFTHDGTHAEYVALPMAGSRSSPRSLSFALAASCGVPYTTAWNALRRGGLVVAGSTRRGRRRRRRRTCRAIALARVLGTTRVVAAAREADVTESLRASGVPIILLTDATGVRVRRAGCTLPGRRGSRARHDRLLGGCSRRRDRGVRTNRDDRRAEGWTRRTCRCVDLYRAGGVLVGINTLLYDVEACAEMLQPIVDAFDNGEIPPPKARDRGVARRCARMCIARSTRGARRSSSS